MKLNFKSTNFDETIYHMETPAIVYLYLYLAIADKDFSDKELKLIVAKLKKNPSFQGMDTEQFVSDIHQNFMRLPFDSVIMYLENYMAEAALSDSEKERVVHDLEEIMEADGVIRKEEMMAFQRIKRYLMPGFGQHQYRASA